MRALLLFLLLNTAPAHAGRADGTLPRFERGLHLRSLLPRAEPAAVGLSASSVDLLLRRAQQSDSNGVLLLKNGKLIADRHFRGDDGPVPLQSVTKSLVSLAVGLLLEEGAISSLDSPLSTWYPEWNEGLKALVTLRHLLNHTSGVANHPTVRFLSVQPDQLAVVRQGPVLTAPGTVFSYNNEATMLLSGILRQAAGEPVDAYLERKLFQPLGFGQWRWERDDAGNTLTYSGLALRMQDLARLGLLLLADGEWRGKHLLPAGWLHQATRTPGSAHSPYYGLLWWLRRGPPGWVQTADRLSALQAAGFTAVANLQGLNGRSFATRDGYWTEAGRLLPDEERAALVGYSFMDLLPFEQNDGELRGFAAEGFGGQFLLVYPQWQLVAVRVTDTGSPEPGPEAERLGFHAFPRLVEETVLRP